MTAAVVDSSVWIDHLSHRDTIQAQLLRIMIVDRHRIVVGDLVLAEVLQGTRSNRDFRRTLEMLSLFEQLTISGDAVAIQAARNYRTLRARGITIRKTIDTLIATRCIIDGLPLLYADRDFDPFVEHLGLVPASGSIVGAN